MGPQYSLAMSELTILTILSNCVEFYVCGFPQEMKKLINYSLALLFLFFLLFRFETCGISRNISWLFQNDNGMIIVKSKCLKPQRRKFLDNRDSAKVPVGSLVHFFTLTRCVYPRSFNFSHDVSPSPLLHSLWCDKLEVGLVGQSGRAGSTCRSCRSTGSLRSW